MKQVTQRSGAGGPRVDELPAPALRPGGVVVATRASLLSAGTERSATELAKASLAGKALARPDLVRQVVDSARREGVAATVERVRARLETPMALGYSCAGRVVEVGAGVPDLAVGGRVGCAGAGYANHAEFNFVPRNLCVPVPDGVDDEDAAFVTVGAIALQGLRQTQPTLGERVVVSGLGLIGLITVQLLKANGCRVLGYDPDPRKAELAGTLGADVACSGGFEEAVGAFTDGRGADAVIVTAATTSDEPLNAAARVSRAKGRVVLVGAVGMNVRRDLFYGKELDLRLSMSYGPGRYDPDYEEAGHDYPFAYVRWTERRNMQAFLELVAAGRVTPKALVTHRFAIDEAEAAYALLSGDDPYIGILLTYPEVDAAPVRRRVDVRRAADRDRPAAGGVGFIGAGNFAKSVLLPRLKRIDGVRFTGVCSATGLTAKTVAERFGFERAATDAREILDDPGTATVFVATRHDTHAALVCDALRAGKHVFVEKPLAIRRDELEAVLAAAGETAGLLTVGFNRRFSPLVRRAKAALAGRSQPLVMVYRVNAGAIPAESWIQRDEGGGRIVGEVCHFIDTMRYLADADPTEVHAVMARDRPDAVSIQMTFADGSIGTVVYTSLGDRAFPKEYLEVFGAGRAIAIDDFRRATIVADGKTETVKSARQDKGFDDELRRFLDAVRAGGPPPIGLAALAAVTEATFAAEDSLRTGAPVPVAAYAVPD